MILIDRKTRYRWVYGLKAKNEVFALLRRWWADTSTIRQKYPLLCLMRDNAGENKTPEIDAYFEDKGVAARYSTSLEQWQDGPAEASIRELGRLVRSAALDYPRRPGSQLWLRVKRPAMQPGSRPHSHHHTSILRERSATSQSFDDLDVKQ
jgi:hypothetical protein